jgi:glyoxylase-like metal-dependent hydrolase (beta-lactamase superfamily II)
MKIKKFTFNPFEENTYVVYDDTMECAIIDPGCYMPEEKEVLLQFIEKSKLKPVLLLNTHCHVDHIFGNKLIYEKYGLKPQFHQSELMLLQAAGEYSKQWGIYLDPSPLAEHFLTEGEQVKFGETTFSCVLAPGHSPGSLCFYQKDHNLIISGDVLFQMSIGRYDLPGGDEKTLLHSIREKLFTLPDEVKVLPGHGPETTIGFEKMYNPLLT